MKAETEYNHMIRLKEELNTLYQIAEISRITMEELQKRELKFFKDNKEVISRCPSRVMARLQMMVELKRDDIHQNKVVWGFLWEGKIYLGWNTLPDIAKDTITKTGEDIGKHYWLKKSVMPRAYKISRREDWSLHIVESYEVTADEY